MSQHPHDETPVNGFDTEAAEPSSDEQKPVQSVTRGAQFDTATNRTLVEGNIPAGKPESYEFISSAEDAGRIREAREISARKAEASGEQEVDGVELLVEMTKNGEIDPWNIDIVKVADQYLQAVAELKESDLKITGKTLLYLAILLRMKSDALAGINYLNPPEEFIDELEPDFMDGGQAIQPKFHFQSLDEVIKRRTSTKQPRIRPVTLTDLLTELKRYEELEKRRSLREKVERSSNRRMMDYADFTADDIEEMAHEEFIEDTILHLRDILERILLKQEEVSLTEIVEEGKIDKISAFLALLFLAARGDFSMHQEEFYSELYVRPDEQLPAQATDFEEEAG